MKSRNSKCIVALCALTALAAPTRLAAQEHHSVIHRSSCYKSLLSGTPRTLSAMVVSMNSNGTVLVNGVDTLGPNTPFQWSWGDGSSMTGWFPETHVYANPTRNYVITITATENSGATQQFSFPVFFVAPQISQRPLPGVSFQIPSEPVEFESHWDDYAPPTDVTPFGDSSFPQYSRSDVAYILGVAASIQKDLANDDTFMPNRILQIDMLENTSFGGGFSFWFTTPMSVGYGPGPLGPPVSWCILFNEPGKDVTLNSPARFTFGGHTDGNASEIYSETMGDIFSYAAGCELVANAASYGIGPDVNQDIENSLLSGAAELQGWYNAYVAAGSPFSSWNPYNGGPDPTGGTISTLAWKFIEHAESQGRGYRIPAKRLMELLQMFNPSMLARYAPQSNTEAAATFRSTLMVAALSYAFSEDLRSEFRNLNFPIDDGTFTRLVQMARWRLFF